MNLIFTLDSQREKRILSTLERREDIPGLSALKRMTILPFGHMTRVSLRIGTLIKSLSERFSSANVPASSSER